MNISQSTSEPSFNEGKRVIREETQILVSPAEYERLCRVMEEAPSPAPQLRKALEQKPVWDAYDQPVETAEAQRDTSAFAQW